MFIFQALSNKFCNLEHNIPEVKIVGTHALTIGRGLLSCSIHTKKWHFYLKRLKFLEISVISKFLE